jgi:hypothetical protein
VFFVETRAFWGDEGLFVEILMRLNQTALKSYQKVIVENTITRLFGYI